MWEKLERSQWMFGEILKFVLNSVYIGASPLPASNFVSFSMRRLLSWLIFTRLKSRIFLFIYLFIYIYSIDR